MTIKEKVIRKSIKIAEERIEEIKIIIYGNHLSNAMRLEIDTIETAKRMYGEGKDPIRFLQEKSREREKLLDLTKQSLNSINLINELVELDMELSDLRQELFFIKRKEQK